MMGLTIKWLALLLNSKKVLDLFPFLFSAFLCEVWMFFLYPVGSLQDLKLIKLKFQNFKNH